MCGVYRIQCNSSSNRSPYRTCVYANTGWYSVIVSNRSPYRIQCNSSKGSGSPYRIQCNSVWFPYGCVDSSSNRSYRYSVIVALTGLPIGYSVM